MLSLQNPLHSHLQNCIIISRMQIITANSKHCEVAAMHSNTFNTMQCISPNALYSPPDCNHCNSLPPNLLHCSQCSVLHSQCSVLHSTSCPQCIADNVPWLALLASLRAPQPPSYSLQFTAAALHCAAAQYAALHCH